MKKIVQGILIVLLVIVVLGCVAVYNLLFSKPDDTQPTTAAMPTMVDTAGESHLVVVDGNGTSYAVVTDAAGNRYAAEYNGNQIGATVGQVNDQIALSDLPTTQGAQVVVTNDPNEYTGQVSTTAPTTVPTTAPAITESTTAPAATDTTAPTQAPVVTEPATDPAVDPYALVPFRIQKYEDIFASGNYFMEITTNDPDLGDMPIGMAIKNGNMFVDTTIEGLKCQMLYLSSNDTMYLIFSEWKKYCKLPQDLLGEDFNMDSMVADFELEGVGEINVSQVELNGQQLIMESYISEADGSTVNYYFNGEDLVRRDSISPEGVVDSIFVSQFMNNAPDSYFEIPDDYGYLNLSWLEAIM